MTGSLTTAKGLKTSTENAISFPSGMPTDSKGIPHASPHTAQPSLLRNPQHNKQPPSSPSGLGVPPTHDAEPVRFEPARSAFYHCFMSRPDRAGDAPRRPRAGSEPRINPDPLALRHPAREGPEQARQKGTLHEASNEAAAVQVEDEHHHGNAGSDERAGTSERKTEVKRPDDH